MTAATPGAGRARARRATTTRAFTRSVPDMPATILTLALASVLLYATATLFLGKRLLAVQASASAVRPKLPAITLAAAALHGVLLYAGIVSEHGLRLGFFNAVSLVAWVAVLLLVAGATRKPLDNLGLLVLPIAALAIVPAVLWPDGGPAPTARGVGADVHLVVSVTAYGMLTIAAVQALLLAFQEKRLSGRRPRGVLHILPPLKVQEELLFELIAIGFVLLTLSLATGLAFIADPLAQHLVHKTVLATAAWVVFGVLLWGRWRHGWRGRTAVRLSLAGFAILALAYFGSKLVLEVILGRHWFSG